MQTTEVKIRLRMNNQVIYEHEVKIKLKKVINYRTRCQQLQTYAYITLIIGFYINQSLKVSKMYVKKKKKTNIIIGATNGTNSMTVT